MNGEIICNGRATLHSFLSHQPSKAQHHEEISVQVIQEGKSSRIFCTQTETQNNSKRPSTVNGEIVLPTMAVNEDLQTLTHKAEEKSKCTQARLPSPAGVTPEVKNTRAPCQRKAGCRRAKTRKPSERTAESKNSNNRKVTDYYPIRRSSRKSKTEIKCEQKKHLDELITKGIENGMMVKHIEGKGRGVFATQSFQKGQYVVEYHGDLLLQPDAKKREALYAQDPATGCYMYYFQYLSKTYCVDATKETDRLGRLINHSKNGNCQTKLHDINGIPHLILVASRDIEEGEELLYDYGDRSKASIAAHPWLKH
ncbi:N-lysine methyltransferase KMT5A-A isoform 2-T2 [Clarias gariepinus]|uniref:N-lysine methyltransferase KMT5A-A isoform X2 n=1 Tax=Clarias gariepinus TaxID=13013 RepID=UPI00234E09F2|nr:N-lysine methyltransferase KMT5A-A isoform X2 [Clarias gariepinus]